MIVKNYEKRFLIIFGIILLYLTEIIFFSFLFYHKEYDYIKFNGIVKKQDLLIVMIEDYELKYFYQSRYMYINDDEFKFKIKQVDKNILIKNKIKYHYLIIKYDMNDNLIENDIVEFNLKKEKRRCIEMPCIYS